jgi:hypothetical protein
MVNFSGRRITGIFAPAKEINLPRLFSGQMTGANRGIFHTDRLLCAARATCRRLATGSLTETAFTFAAKLIS